MSYFIFIVPFLFAFMNRLRGTKSDLVLGKYKIGYSVFYSLSTGIVSFLITKSYWVLVLATLMFHVGELRNWQEKGYYINGSKKLSTISELVFRGCIWYVPVIVLVGYYSGVDWFEICLISAYASLSFWVSIDISTYLWNKYSELLHCDNKYFYIGNIWTLDEVVKGFMFGIAFVLLNS